MALASLVVLLPISQPHPLKILTTFGVMAAVRGTLIKMKDLWIAYANANCVAKPGIQFSKSFLPSRADKEAAWLPKQITHLHLSYSAPGLLRHPIQPSRHDH
jgi:hypothetical protein